MNSTPFRLSESRSQKDLLLALAADTVAGIATAACVTPAVAIIDRSIIANVSGRTPLINGLKDGLFTLLRKPFTFARQPSVMVVFAVYSGTYVTANSSESICRMSCTDPTLPKFISSSMVNISLTIWKDRLLTRWFGVGTPKPFPTSSYALFASRDCLTMAASFTLPPHVSRWIQQNTPLTNRRTADTLAQLVLPCAIQLVSTPIHLLGLDMYNRPLGSIGANGVSRISSADRALKVAQGYPSSTLARIARIMPAFGLGGVVNTNMRSSLKSFFGVVDAQLHTPVTALLREKSKY
ncbi:hypothetical protein HDU76_005475 [Blyttiomyces sp. JEL0837]|nr:hypothetical protein HDU76_005475 [Blyttiomyces sp. JEL0837]